MLIFVDCEANGPCPAKGNLTEFGAVSYPKRETFHGVIYDRETFEPLNSSKEVFTKFAEWLKKASPGEMPIFISDNPAFDWQWINDGFWKAINKNPFGHSARRIGDFYAGLVGDFRKASKWKKLRITKHDHNPVHDALGNVEAFDRMIKGER